MPGPIQSAFKSGVLLPLGLAAAAALQAAPPPPNVELGGDRVAARVEDLLRRMTLSEKVGQTVQFPAGREGLGPKLAGQDFDALIAQGAIGGINVSDAARANAYQKLAVEKTRLRIPLIIGLDVIHGYHTVYPIPLGLAATFDPDLVAAVSRMAAKEATADGIRMTNSPMVDIARDARWGRCAEGAGESPYLGSAMARAYVRGYQGATLGDPTSMAACVKHFAAYGAVIAGRDYNAADMSDVTLRQVYLPPYHAAVDAGAATIMCAFNTLNGVPESADPYTLTDILRGEWGFQGFVRADYNAVGELIAHGVARDGRQAAEEAFLAGVDMDMASNLYRTHLASLVQGGQVPEARLDEAVRRILRVKFALGLFEHPYVEEAGARAAARVTREKRALARKAAEESIVLLQNGGALPISKTVKRIALIGPLGDAANEMLGTWHAKGRPAAVVTLRAALAERMKQLGGQFEFVEGTPIVPDEDDTTDLAAAVKAARAADVVVMALGEDAATMTGEATSRSDIGLPGRQNELLRAVAAAGKPVVVVVFSGRPVVLTEAAHRAAAVVEAWFPGIEAGPALGDVLFGDVSPSGKLPMSFPRATGQEPLYLAQLPTGRPDPNPDRVPEGRGEKFVSAYVDVPNSPLFPFGWGLGYPKFQYSEVAVSASKVRIGDLARTPVVASVTVTNQGQTPATDVVQLYLRIRGASVEQPVRDLKGFERVTLAPGESKHLAFPLGYKDLAIVNAKSQQVVEPCEYTVFIGGDSKAPGSAVFETVR